MTTLTDRRAEIAVDVQRDDRLLEIATCEGCNWNPAQYWTRTRECLCEGCVAERESERVERERSAAA